MAKGGALNPVYIVTDDELEINGGDFVLQQGPAMKVRGFSLDNYAGRKIKGGALQPVYIVPEASAPSLYGGHWRVTAGQPKKVISMTEAERNIYQGPAIPVYPVDDAGNYDPTFAGGGPVPPPFVPTDIPGLIRWYDFNDTATLFQDAARTVPVVADGDPIGGVIDKSVTADHARQITDTKRPLYKAGIQNGKNIGRFDGVDDWFQITSINQVPLSVFAAVKDVDPGGASMLFGTTGNNQYYLYDGNALMTFFVQNVFGGSTKALVDGIWNLLCAIYPGATTRCYVNGVGGVPNAEGGLPWIPDLWGCYNGYGISWQGDMGEILVYNTALSDADRILVETYMNTKWAVY